MYKFRVSEAFGAQRKLLILAGVWPIKSTPFTYNLFGFVLSFLIQDLFIVPSLLLFYFNSVDVAQGSFILFCNIAAICYQLKLGVFCVKRDTFRQILADLDQGLFQPSTKQHGEYVNSSIMLSKRIRSMMYIPSVFFCILLAVYPALDRSTERPLPFSLPIDVDSLPYFVYMVIYVMEVIAGGVATINNTNLDTLACTLMILCSVQLKILGEKLQDILSANLAGQEDLESYRMFDDVVAVRYVEKLEETFTYEFLAQFITGLLLICTAAFSFIVIPISNAMFATAASFFAIASVEMAIYCMFGNEIIVESTNIRDCCYLSKWNQCGPTICKSLIIMMERTKRPLVLSAGKFANLSHESLIAIIKSSFSYFVVIRKLYG